MTPDPEAALRIALDDLLRRRCSLGHSDARPAVATTKLDAQVDHFQAFGATAASVRPALTNGGRPCLRIHAHDGWSSHYVLVAFARDGVLVHDESTEGRCWIDERQPPVPTWHHLAGFEAAVRYLAAAGSTGSLPRRMAFNEARNVVTALQGILPRRPPPAAVAQPRELRTARISDGRGTPA